MRRLRFGSFHHCFAGSLAMLFASALPAAAPALREQLSLNGEWPVGGPVPTYTGIRNFDQRTYERDVTVPASWSGKIIKVEFGAVNFIATVSIDGDVVHENIGGWCPFTIDITSRAKPGAAFRLKVHVKGPTHPPIVDENNAVAWPVGGWKTHGGIADDVWLRAYGPVHIEDAFIQTSVAKKGIVVDYTVRNATGAAQTIVIEGDVVRASSGLAELKLAGLPVQLGPREVRVMRVAAAFQSKATPGPFCSPHNKSEKLSRTPDHRHRQRGRVTSSMKAVEDLTADWR